MSDGYAGDSPFPVSMGTDVAEACTNVPEADKQTKRADWVRFYGKFWDGVAPANAQKIYGLVWQRQVDTWDKSAKQPTEKLFGFEGEVCSMNHARYNSHTNGGNYILDTLNENPDPSKSNSVVKGDPKYRETDPTQPGYAGPYFKHV